MDFESFEYVDRNYDSKIVQVGMFQRITSKDQIKVGDRFICPPSEEYKSGIVDAHTMKPILVFYAKETTSEWHLPYSYHEDQMKKTCPAIAWDLCYLLRNDESESNRF